MICQVCRWEMTERPITVDLRVGNKLLVVEKVPATVCDHCGEKIFTPAVTKKLQVLAKLRKKPPKTIKVPVYSLELGVA